MPRISWMFVQLTAQVRLFIAILGLDYRYPTAEIIADDQRIIDGIRSQDPARAETVRQGARGRLEESVAQREGGQHPAELLLAQPQLAAHRSLGGGDGHPVQVEEDRQEEGPQEEEEPLGDHERPFMSGMLPRSPAPGGVRA